MTTPPAGLGGLEQVLADLAAVLGRPVPDARADTPLVALGADAVALLLWADRVEAAAPGAAVDADGLAAAATVGDLVALRSATMGEAARSTGGEQA